MRHLLSAVILILAFYHATTICIGHPISNDLEPSQVSIAFSPDKQAQELILSAIAGAESSIKVAAYSFTSKTIALALLEAHNRGIKVEVVADAKSGKGRYSAVTFLANQGIPVRLNDNYAIFHHKFMIIDNAHVQTGSFNYSAAAANKNAENVLILWNMPDAAVIYTKEWQKLWNEAKALNPAY